MTLVVYETIEDLGSVLLRISSDVNRTRFDQVVQVLAQHNIVVKRFDARKDAVAIEKHKRLPAIYVDDVLVHEGSYPTIERMASLTDIAIEAFDNVNHQGALYQAANDGRIGFCCGVGTDVYLDPYEGEHN